MTYHLPSNLDGESPTRAAPVRQAPRASSRLQSRLVSGPLDFGADGHPSWPSDYQQQPPRAQQAFAAVHAAVWQRQPRARWSHSAPIAPAGTSVPLSQASTAPGAYSSWQALGQPQAPAQLAFRFLPLSPEPDLGGVLLVRVCCGLPDGPGSSSSVSYFRQVELSSSSEPLSALKCAWLLLDVRNIAERACLRSVSPC